LEFLSHAVGQRVSEKRFRHILGVERCAKRLADALIPERTDEIRAAALLHDVSKEIPIDEQFEMLANEGFDLTEEDKITVGVIHSFTAPIIISRDFSDYATDDILSATLKHTVGSQSMSIFDLIIFISDYAEDTRSYESCINVRNRLFDGFDALSYKDKIFRLKNACLEAIEGTCDAIRRSGGHVNSRMLKTKNSLQSKLIP
jgi:predicted HD superfamily hydrolase involved in NAD metabolism